MPASAYHLPRPGAARFALVLGDQELKTDRAKLKELKTGSQHEVPLSGLAAEVKKLGGGPP